MLKALSAVCSELGGCRLYALCIMCKEFRILLLKCPSEGHLAKMMVSIIAFLYYFNKSCKWG